MPVRSRKNRRTSREDFEITPAIRAAFDAYQASQPKTASSWPEHWILHDALHEAGLLDLPFVPPCCWHLGLHSIRWQYMPQAVAIYHHLAN